MAAINFQRATLEALRDRMRELLDEGKAGRTIAAVKEKIGTALDRHNDPVPLEEPAGGWRLLRAFAFGYCPSAYVAVTEAVKGVPA